MENDPIGYPAGDVAQILPRLAPGLHLMARRRMLLPALLLLASHRPLAFVAGQVLWLCSPFEMLVPTTRLGDWAALLSHPQGGPALEHLLEELLTDGSVAGLDGNEEGHL